MSELIEVLDPGKFYQINRNTIAAISAIIKISNYFNRRVIVQLRSDNREVVVSRERVQNFKDWLNK
jgi:two-component system LytT family response regulator